MSANPHGASDFDESDRDLRVLRLERRVEALELIVKELHERLEELRSAPVERPDGRNKSSAQKRDMTDADAERCLVGDCAALNHKLAAEAMGLTYAQVYSCRLQYTFKHVHKRLRDEAKFESPWRK